MNVQKAAKQDAYEFARAQMAFGEGAGTRRRLIKAQVDHRIDTVPGYASAYYEEALRQNMEQHAKRAKTERKAKDLTKHVQRNARGVLTGNTRNLTPVVALGFTIWSVARSTGADVEIKRVANAKYQKAKAWAKWRRMKRQVVKEGERRLRLVDGTD